jgi:hypothetical protein
MYGCTKSEFDIFAKKPVQSAVLGIRVWDYNKRRLQGLTSMVCGQYTCLFALYMDRGYTPRQFIDMFTSTAAAVDPDLQVQRLFVSEFGRGPYIKWLV